MATGARLELVLEGICVQYDIFQGAFKALMLALICIAKISADQGHA